MSNDKHSHWFYMRRCEAIGQAAAQKGNSPVGALIVRNGEIVCEAEEANKTKNDVTCHAEIEALRIVVQTLKTNNLSDCILYTTHEPCIMCSYAIRFYKIRKVVFLHSVEYLGGATSSMPLLVSGETPPKWGKAPDVIKLSTEKDWDFKWI